MTASQFTRGPAMRDVATAAGVSAQTVSRVLNDHPNVQESTRRRVLAVVEELGYRRNNTARALVTGQSKTIGVLTLATNNYSRSSLALGVELGAREAGYTVNSVTSSLSVQALTDAVRTRSAGLASTTRLAADHGARQRRVRGRKAKRVSQQTLLEHPEDESVAPESVVPETKKPEQTKDDTDAGWGEQHDESAYDRYLREQRPPHWGSD